VVAAARRQAQGEEADARRDDDPFHLAVPSLFAAARNGETNRCSRPIRLGKLAFEWMSWSFTAPASTT
jgi:hypothetical protein